MIDNLGLDFNKIVNMIEIRRNNAYKKVNEELIGLYWDFGKYVSELVSGSEYGNKTIEKIAEFLKNKYPTLKGFNRRGIYRMKQFYETYKNYPEIVSTVLTQLSWSNHLQILSSTKTFEEKKFYMELAIKEKYSARQLDRQITSAYYERYMLSGGEIGQSLNKAEADYHNTKILDTYSLEFLDLPNEYSEKDLKKAIIKNMKNFILEVGRDFTFIGDEYKVQVGNHDFYIDLLFYNRSLSCLVAFELKLGEFKAEYLGKMNLYLEALDRQEKKENENPSVGVILCSTKDEEVVEYAMSRTMSPTMVSNYTLNLIDKKLLENKLREIKELVDKSNL